MARLIPKIDPDEIENEGERFLAKQLLNHLGADVEIYHSFRYLTSNRRGTLYEGECDFVVLDPDNGMLFIEVKGGKIEYNPRTENWERIHKNGGIERIKSPLDQCTKNMHALVDKVIEQKPFDKTLPFTFGFAVAFPHCRYEGPLPASITGDLLIDENKCNDLKRVIQKIYDRWNRKAHHPLGTREMDAVRSALFPRFAIMPVLWRKVEDQEERLRRLTSDQQKLLEFIASHKKAAIRGVAGSGKTILALGKAQEMARKGYRTLFLCYNKPLKEWIETAIPEDAEDNLVVETYHGLVADLTAKAGTDFRPEPGQKADQVFWDEKAPEYLEEALLSLGNEHKFDALIVDEGQDFRDLWWDSLENVFRDPSDKECYYVFYDPKQNLYVENPSLPAELGKPFELPINCRNTIKIAEHCAELVNIDPGVKDGAPMGDKPEILPAADVNAAMQKASKKVQEWIAAGKGGIKYSQVAVLAPSMMHKRISAKIGNVPTTRSFNAWRKNEGVLFTSTKLFKGLEADAILIIESSECSESASEKYVARSRAKHLLAIIQIS